MSNTIKLPVTFYQDVTITDEMLIELLKEEQKKLLPSGWDCLIIGMGSNKRTTLYREGYGSHNIGEAEEECHDKELISKYKAFDNVIRVLELNKEK